MARPKDDSIRLAEACSTCRYSYFKPTNSSHNYYGGRAKRQTGLCLLHCNGTPPNQAQGTSYWFTLRTSDGETNYYSLKSFSQKHGHLPDKDLYIAAIRTERSNITNLIERLGAIIKDANIKYDKFKAEWEWWQENYEKSRPIHRQTLCNCYEEGHKGKESKAKSIINKYKKQV